jgi:hypothetical protein
MTDVQLSGRVAKAVAGNSVTPSPRFLPQELVVNFESHLARTVVSIHRKIEIFHPASVTFLRTD